VVINRSSFRFLAVAALARAVVACSDDPDTISSPAPAPAMGNDAAVSDTRTTPTDTAASARANVAGKMVHKEMVEGREREFIVYVPEKAKGSAPVPVVFIVHGTSQDGEHFFAESRWKEKSDAEGIITVFPTALTYCYKEDENADGDFDDPGERRVTTKWAAGHLGDPKELPLCNAEELATLTAANRAKADHPLQDDVAFFEFMLDFLAEKYAIDAKRVYATGFSNGACMTSRLGNDRPHRFAAVAAHAGGMNVAPVAAEKPITFVFSVGNVDDRFTATSIPLSESLATSPAFSNIVDDYLTAANVASTYTYDEPSASGKTMSRFVYAKSNVGASNMVVAVVIEGCFHQYPNGTNHPLVMANALWDVFKTRSLP
jgi:polyhydroxybutyrate depolymerase